MFGWLKKVAIAVKPIVNAVVKGAGATIACQLCYYLTTKPADAGGWVETPTEELVQITGYSRYQVENARRKLVQLGLIEEVHRYGNKIWSRTTNKRVTVVKYTVKYELASGKTRSVEKIKSFPESFTAEQIEAALPKATSINIQGHYTLLELYADPSLQDSPEEPPPIVEEKPKKPPEPVPIEQSQENHHRAYYTTNQHPCEKVDDRFNSRGAIPEWKKSRSPQDYTDEAIECVMAYLASFSKENAKDPGLRKKAISHLFKLEKDSRFGEIKEILRAYRFNRFTSKIPERFREAYPYYLILRQINARAISNDHPDFVKYMLASNSVHHVLEHYEKDLEKLYEELNNDKNHAPQST